MKLHWIRVGPNPMTAVLIRGWNLGHTERETPRGEGHMQVEQRLE